MTWAYPAIALTTALSQWLVDSDWCAGSTAGNPLKEHPGSVKMQTQLQLVFLPHPVHLHPVPFQRLKQTASQACFKKKKECGSNSTGTPTCLPLVYPLQYFLMIWHCNAKNSSLVSEDLLNTLNLHSCTDFQKSFLEGTEQGLQRCVRSSNMLQVVFLLGNASLTCSDP